MSTTPAGAQSTQPWHTDPLILTNCLIDAQWLWFIMVKIGHSGRVQGIGLHFWNGKFLRWGGDSELGKWVFSRKWYYTGRWGKTWTNLFLTMLTERSRNGGSLELIPVYHDPQWISSASLCLVCPFQWNRTTRHGRCRSHWFAWPIIKDQKAFLVYKWNSNISQSSY